MTFFEDSSRFLTYSKNLGEPYKILKISPIFYKEHCNTGFTDGLRKNSINKLQIESVKTKKPPKWWFISSYKNVFLYGQMVYLPTQKMKVMESQSVMC